MSRASSDVFEDMESVAHLAAYYSRKADYLWASDYIKVLRVYLDEAQKRLELEVEMRRKVESGHHDESTIESA